MPAPEMLLRNFAARSGRTEHEVSLVWARTQELVGGLFGVSEPKGDASETDKEQYYALRLESLNRLLGIGAARKGSPTSRSQVNELKASDVLGFLSGAMMSKDVSLRCAAKHCASNNGKGKCSRPARSIEIDRNWECKSFARKKNGKVAATR